MLLIIISVYSYIPTLEYDRKYIINYVKLYTDNYNNIYINII